MEKLIYRYLLPNWERKLVALIAAIVTWAFVSHSITGTKAISDVSVRVINISPHKTIRGMQPGGLLNKEITLTLKGTKSVIEHLEPGDIEVVLDASHKPEDWNALITRKNIVSLNPAIDLTHHISRVSHLSLPIKFSPLVTAKVPVIITHPVGAEPKGYEFLDIWPRRLTHTVTGPEEEVKALQRKGVKLSLDLSKISNADLEILSPSHQNPHAAEISFYVPKEWKQIKVPFQNNHFVEINDPEAEQLHIDFLQKQLLLIERPIPLHVFYPTKFLDEINPTTHSLATNEVVQEFHGTYALSLPLFVADVSQLFLDIVQNHMEITIIAAPSGQREFLDWSVEFIDQNSLENTYVALLKNHRDIQDSGHHEEYLKGKEAYLRNRFRDYVQKFVLFTQQHKALELNVKLGKDQIVIESS